MPDLSSATMVIDQNISRPPEESNTGLILKLKTNFGQQGLWEFTGPKAIVIGRGEGSAILLPDNDEHSYISRHHAVIELGRAKAIIRDLGSLNGTYLNGHLVGQRSSGRSRRLGLAVAGSGVHLNHGDTLTLGSFTFEISLTENKDFQAGLNSPQYGDPNPNCPGCDQAHLGPGVAPNDYLDKLCSQCLQNPTAALKVLQAGLKRKIPQISALKGFKVIDVLGRGSTSAVFLIVRKSTGEKMALKVLSPNLAENEWARKSFLREIAICRRLNHVNVAKIYDYGYYAGVFFYLMEYCRAKSAEELRLAQGGYLDILPALAIILDSLDGLHYLHTVKIAPTRIGELENPQSVGLVHRDLKPANIFLGGHANEPLIPKIADIGVGKSFSNAGFSGHTRTGSVAGSPATMPRQQVINFKYSGPEVDIWAMAACLYKLLTSEYPRDFPLEEDPWRVVLTKKAVPILERRDDIPKNIAKLIDKALIDNPYLYFKSALSFKEALLEAMKNDNLIFTKDILNVFEPGKKLAG